MRHHELDDDDWDTEDYDSDGDETVPCPECGRPVSELSDKCPACGYWLTANDRYATSFSATKRRWLVVTAWVVLAVFLVPLAAIVMTVLRRTPSE